MFVFVLDFWIYQFNYLILTYISTYYYIIIFFWIFSPKNSIFHDTFTISFDTNTGKYYIMINVIYIIIAYIVLF